MIPSTGRKLPHNTGLESTITSHPPSVVFIFTTLHQALLLILEGSRLDDDETITTWRQQTEHDPTRPWIRLTKLQGFHETPGVFLRRWLGTSPQRLFSTDADTAHEHHNTSAVTPAAISCTKQPPTPASS